MAENGSALAEARKSIILYYGTFEPYQGLDLLADSIETVVLASSHVLFMFVGGTPEQVTRLRRNVEEKGLGEYVLFTGTVPPQEIPRYTAMADILVSPRVGGSNTPLKIYSYLRSGKAIVATDHPSHTQVLTRDIAMLTAARPEAIAEGIITLLKDKALRDRLVRNAASFAEEHFRWENVREKIRLMYDTLADQRSGR
jgi:glycosyltransferase involved in cell wall biosynthesis